MCVVSQDTIRPMCFTDSSTQAFCRGYKHCGSCSAGSDFEGQISTLSNMSLELNLKIDNVIFFLNTLS